MLFKNISRALLLITTLSGVALSSCQEDMGDDGKQTSFTISGEEANGAKERPNPVTTNATGTINGTYNETTNTLNYTITWTGLSGPPTAAHFHGPADRNTAAGVVIPIQLPANATESGSVTGTATLTDQQETELLNEQWYYNIHTGQNPGGEIRGQVVAR